MLLKLFDMNLYSNNTDFLFLSIQVCVVGIVERNILALYYNDQKTYF